jgi:UDP-GlcNAc:undecaprenyl-phosphate GlcNAc-1-phosphate transferase
MDGLDGLAGGVTSTIGIGFLFLVTYMAMASGAISPGDVQGSGLRIVLALALLGAVMAFTPHNFNPASIFMGDTGSMFLGFNCAILIVMMAELDTRWLLASLVMFALPVLDTSLAFARRWVNRRPVFSADRMHFHHQLVMRGLTVRKTVIVSYFLSIAFVALGSAIIFMRTRYAVAIYLVVLGWIIVAAYKMGMVHEKPAVVSAPTGKDFETAASAATGPIDASSVLEVREEEKRQPPLAPPQASPETPRGSLSPTEAEPPTA